MCEVVQLKTAVKKSIDELDRFTKQLEKFMCVDYIDSAGDDDDKLIFSWIDKEGRGRVGVYFPDSLFYPKVCICDEDSEDGHQVFAEVSRDYLLKILELEDRYFNAKPKPKKHGKVVSLVDREEEQNTVSKIDSTGEAEGYTYIKWQGFNTGDMMGVYAPKFKDGTGDYVFKIQSDDDKKIKGQMDKAYLHELLKKEEVLEGK